MAAPLDTVDKARPDILDPLALAVGPLLPHTKAGRVGDRQGETIVTNEAGLSDFHALRSAITRRPQDKGRYMGGAFVTFKADKRQALWDRVQGKVGAPPPKGLAKEKAEWLKPGLVGRVKFLKGEDKLRHASLKDFWEDAALNPDGA